VKEAITFPRHTICLASGGPGRKGAAANPRSTRGVWLQTRRPQVGLGDSWGFAD